MSHLFDAIQRSEAERTGVQSAEAPAATEFLAKVEKRAAEEWETGEKARSAKPRREIAPVAPGNRTVQETAASSPRQPAAGEPVRSRQDAETFPDFPVVQIETQAQSRLVCLTDEDDAATEAFRLLAVRLRDLRRKRPVGTLLITSSIPQEGKSLVTSNLGCMLSQGESHRVLLIDADLRRPTQGKLFGLGRLPGLRDYLEDKESIESCIVRLEGAGVWMMPAGRGNSNALELVESSAMAALLERVSAWFDWVVIDSPPLIPLADTSVLFRLVDGALLIARQGTSKKRQLEKALEILDRRKLLGVVLNCAQGTAYGGYYYYHDQESSGDREKKD